jgi:hypothetical protein
VASKSPTQNAIKNSLDINVWRPELVQNVALMNDGFVVTIGLIGVAGIVATDDLDDGS